MYLIESFIKGKESEELCEDNLFVGENYIAVVDGATSCSHIKINKKCGGKFLSDKIVELLSVVDKNQHMSSRDLINYINNEIKKEYELNNIDTSDKKNVPAASAVIYNINLRELIFVGDCQALVVFNDGTEREIKNDKKIDDLTSSVRAFYIQSMKKLGEKTDFKCKGDDVGRTFIEELIKRQRAFENTMGSEYSYSTLNGFTAEIRVEKLPENVSELILASDGYPILKRKLKETEQCLADLIKRDPLLIGQYKSTKGSYDGYKSFDDRAFLRVGF